MPTAAELAKLRFEGLPEPPDADHVYGRHNGAWVAVVPLSGA